MRENSNKGKLVSCQPGIILISGSSLKHVSGVSEIPVFQNKILFLLHLWIRQIIEEFQIMPEDDPDGPGTGLKEDGVASTSKNPAGQDHSRKSWERRVYPLYEIFSLNLHINNIFLSNQSEEHCKKREARSFELSDWLNERICCRETVMITTLQSIYKRIPTNSIGIATAQIL